MGNAAGRVAQWLDRLGGWPYILGAVGIVAGYATGLLTLIGRFPLLVQLSVYGGAASIAVGVLRALLRRAARPAPQLIVTGLPGRMLMVFNNREADGVWIEVTNGADKPQGDAADVFATITIFGVDGQVILPAFLARWRDSPYPTPALGAGDITDRQTIRAAQFRQLDVAFKYHGDETAHALNTDAMQYPDWIKPGWELAPGVFQIKVRLSGTNLNPRDSWFRVANPESGAITIESQPAP